MTLKPKSNKERGFYAINRLTDEECAWQDVARIGWEFGSPEDETRVEHDTGWLRRLRRRAADNQ
jgi:hypothetical protein